MVNPKSNPRRLEDETTPDFPIDAADLIVALGRGLQVIESFDDENPRMTAAMVCQRTGIPRTAARRHLLSLCHFGYAQTDGKFFWLAPRVLRLGQSYLGAARLPRLVQPFIQRAAMASGETINVSVLDGHEVVYVARSNSPRLVGIGFQAGARAPAHVVAPGYAILSTFTDAALDAWIAAHAFTGFTADSPRDPARFRDEVLAARAAGHVLTEQQLDPGLRGIAVPLRDRHGGCAGAIGSTMSIQPLTREQTVDRMLPVLRELAQELRPLL
jgi:IclR family pca regulon transcriptional regulator